MASVHSSWRFGKRNKLRLKVSQDPEDFYRLDVKKSAFENAYDIYKMLCCRDTRDNKRLFLLNALASLCLASDAPPHNSIRFSTEDLLYCLSASLVHTFTQVRAAALRTIRYALTTPKDVKTFNSLQLQHLLCRSIDLMIKNDDERVQALKLVRKMLAIAPDDISPVVVRCLVSLADSGIEESDNLLRACLATLAEFAVLNPALLIVCGGVSSITRNVLECHNPRIAESLCGVLLYLLEWPQTRNICGVRLDCLATPYCDFTYRLGIMDKNKDARELRYTSCRLALLSVLRSWTGILEFCDPNKPSGLKAIVDALYLNQIEVRKAILDLLFELLGLSQPAWTDDYIVAMQAVDPADFQDSWLLSNGFVTAEGRSILPSLAARAPNVVEQHLALMLYCFLETGLLNALVEVAVSPDQFVSVRATVLIGKILQLMHTHLPADICSTSPALPTLIGHATQGNQRANDAVAALQSYQKMLRQRPASNSLFLDSIIQSGGLVQSRLFRRHINASEQTPTAGAGGATTTTTGGATCAPTNAVETMHQLASSPVQYGGSLNRPRLDSVSSSDESNSQAGSSLRSSFRLKRKFLPQGLFDNFRSFHRLLNESNVLTQADSNAWDWEVIITILRSNLTRKLDYTLSKFLKCLVDFYKPSNNRFSHRDLVPGQAIPAYVTAGLDLIDVLLYSNELECMRFITDYFSDISLHLLAVTTSNRAHDCLFSPQHMNNTMCQQYFLYIGRMCRSAKGINILINTAVFEYLITLVRHTHHVCYVKLIVSGLNYSQELAQKVLTAALTSAKTRNGRLYATQFLAVLLRARLPNFEVWGIPMIIQQTKDPDRSVVLAAMDVLEEACHEKYYLEEIVSLWPNLKALGDVGRLLMSRYYSLSRGLNNSNAKIKEEIDYWRTGYNKRYVLLVEADTHSSLTLHVRNEDGYYSRRNCNIRPTVVPPNIVPHLYGQMVQTAQGMTALRKHGDLPHLIEIIGRGKCTDETECLELKAAVWALCHASTHSNGIEYFTEIGARLHEKLIMLVTTCDVYSVRASCFSGIGLIAGTEAGANILFKLNWLSVRHDRNTMWPVHHPEDWLPNNYTPVRHHFEDMPPYNYTAIEDQVDGSYFTGSYWNVMFNQSGNQSRAATAAAGSSTSELLETELPKSCNNNATVNANKSKTLPEGTNIRQVKHQRSLSESKTTDVISILCGGGGGGGGVGGTTNPVGINISHYPNRIRYNSCTDSNTSGVSSCESVTGRTAAAAMSDFQQIPLSPIPSMSNLLELPIPRKQKLLRHTSLLGTSYGSHALSPLAMKGYAQLRSLRAHSRPVFSESAAELCDIIDMACRAEMRPRKSSWGESQRKLKVRSLDRPPFLNVFTRLSSEELQMPLPTLNGPKFLSHSDNRQGPCYAGICLPKNAFELFPTRNLQRTYVSCDIQDSDLMGINLLTANQQFLNDSLTNECCGGDESSVISSLSDVSSVSKRQPLKWHQQQQQQQHHQQQQSTNNNNNNINTINAKHGRSHCLLCTRSRRTFRLHQLRVDEQQQQQQQQQQQTISTINDGGAGANAGGSYACDLANFYGINRKCNASGKPTVATESSSTIQLSDISFNSPESVLSEDSMPDRLTASILYNIQRLANPVSAKQSKMSLLELKQKHPNAFQDICLYSAACITLGRSNYRMSARRFLQELFLDLNFDSFYVEPQDILNKMAKLSGVHHVHGDMHVDMNESLPLQPPQPSSTSVSSSSSSSTTTTTVATTATATGATMNSVVNTNAMGNTNTSSGSGSGGGGGSSLSSSSGSVSVCGSSSSLSSGSLTQLTGGGGGGGGGGSGSGGHKTTQLKSKPLASVYETSCENLLMDQMNSRPNCNPTPLLKATMSMNTTTTSTTTNELYITTDEDDGPPTSSSSPPPITSGQSKIPIPIPTTAAAAAIAITTITTTVGPPLMVNENKQYSRGRFYTLELDLSCTKNIFPITERRTRNSSISLTSSSSSAAAASSTIDPNTNTNNNPNRHRMHRQMSADSGATLAAASLTNQVTNVSKSLASSMPRPSLYCEKRLQSSKSEAILADSSSSNGNAKYLTTTAAVTTAAAAAATTAITNASPATTTKMNPPATS